MRQWGYIVAILSEKTYLPIYLYVTPKNLNMKKKAPPPKKNKCLVILPRE